MSIPGVTYYIFSISPNGLSVGTLNFQAEKDQPVLLDVEPIEWFANPDIGPGNPTRLRVGSYLYTAEVNGEVYASNDPKVSQDWFLIPTNDDKIFIVAVDPDCNRVWTAGEPRDSIKIKPFTGETDQLFKFSGIYI